MLSLKSTSHLRGRWAGVVGAAIGALLTLSQPAVAQQKLTIGQVTATTLTFAPVIFANNLRFFHEEGIEMEIVEFDGSATMIPQVVSRRITVGYPNPDPLIVGAQPGRDRLPLKFFYNATRASAWEFVVPEGSAIRSLTDLKGKAVGVGSLTFGNIPITRAMFKELGMEVGRDVELVPVGTGAPAFRALTSGQIAALNLFDVQHATLEATGVAIRRLPMPERYLDLFSNGFVAHEETIRSQAGLLAGFGRAVAKGTVACEAAPENCVRSFWKTYPAQRPAGAGEDEAVARSVKIMRSRFDKFLVFVPGQQRRFGEFSQASWKDFVKTLYEGGQISTPEITVDPLFTNELVPEFNRFDTDTVRKAARDWRP